MKIINPSVEILTPINGEEILKHIESCGRVCYKSEDKITDESCYSFVRGIVTRKHEAVLEHFNITVKFICDRGVSHELVRHRIASYCQESTRYCNYGKEDEITVINPCFFTEDDGKIESFWEWKRAMENCEKSYMELLKYGATPQEARSVLPNSLKTEVIMTANLREWRSVLKLRTSKAAHPQIVQVMAMLLEEFKNNIPVVFDDIEVGA